MRRSDRIKNEYFQYMKNVVCDDRYSDQISYNKLLTQLHKTEFIYCIRNDANRAEDGICLRRRFALINNDEGLSDYLDGPCSVLEMIVALAIRCEESTMDNTEYGDRTAQWFWGMITNLGLGSMTDDRYDRMFVKDVLYRFLNREYEPNGRGGLFTIKDRDSDLRDVEIWYQLNWYLDSIT